MYPPLCLTIPYTVDSPSPVPFPISLVVKNGSKTRWAVSSSIPVPVSATASMTYDPGLTGRCPRAYASSSSTFAVSIVSFPLPAWRPGRSRPSS